MSSSGAPAAATYGAVENRGGQQNGGDTRGVKKNYTDGDGIYDTAATSVPKHQPQPVSLFAQHKGGMQAFTYRPGFEPTSLDQRESSDVVFLGIIDTLVPFKLRKKVCLLNLYSCCHHMFEEIMFVGTTG